MPEDRSQAYRSLYFAGLCNFVKNPDGQFVDKLCKTDFMPGQDAISKAIFYYVEDSALRPIYGGLANDTAAFVLKLYETLLEIKRKENTKSLAWQFIKFYYAAFFSCQILMRLTGQWPARLTALDKYSELFEVYNGKKPEINKNLFICSYDGLEKFVCLPFDESGGRSHQTTWAILGNHLEYMIKNLLNSTPNTVFVETAGDLRKLTIDLGNSYDFLSNTRNDINYRMGHGIWYPQDKLAKREWEIYLKLLTIELNVANPPVYNPRSNSTAQKFLGCCKFLIDLTLWMMKDISTTRPTNKFLSSKSSVLVANIDARQQQRN
jgi:hypothetical protein